MASVIAFACVQAMLFLRSLNQIAKVCAVFYLLSYAFVNLACCLLDLSSAVNFRPTRSCHWAAAALGAIACCALMPFMSPVATLVGMACAGLFAVLVTFVFPPERKDWGSVGQGLLYHQVNFLNKAKVFLCTYYLLKNNFLYTLSFLIIVSV